MQLYNLTLQTASMITCAVHGNFSGKKYQEIIFQIFETAGERDKFGIRGNGIGLATVKKIVIKSRGTIKLESEKGKGAKFIFTLEK